MTCKRSEQCDHADLCQFAKSTDYNLLGGSCFEPKDQQTNEEYLKSCTTEMLAVAIFKAICISAEMIHCEITLENRSGTELKEAIYEWLQQPHGEVGK